MLLALLACGAGGLDATAALTEHAYAPQPARRFGRVKAGEFIGEV